MDRNTRRGERPGAPLLLALVAAVACSPSEPLERSEPSASVARSAVSIPDLPEGIDPRVRAAIEAAGEAVRAAPESAEAWGALGRVLHAHELHDGAERAYREAAARGAEAPDRYRLALVEIELGREADAAERLRTLGTALREASVGDYPPRAYLAAELAIRAGRREEALRALDDRPTDEPPAARLRARAHLSLGDPEAAIEALEALLRRRPNDPYARFLRDSAERRLGRPTSESPPPPAPSPRWADPWRDALDDLRVGYREQFDRASAEIATDPARAAAGFEELVRQRPHSANLWINLGIARQRTGELAASRAALERAVALQPERELAHLQLAVTLARLARSGAAAESLGDPLVGAREHALEAVALTPDSAHARAVLGEVEAAGGRIDAAIDAYRSAQERDERWTPTLARLLATQSRWSEVASLLSSFGGTSESADALYLLGVARFNEGSPDAARTHWERALELEPTHREAIDAIARFESSR